MIKFFLLNCLMFISLVCLGQTTLVQNGEELKKASKNAKPGDIIILKNGTWNDVDIKLESMGTEKQPITFKAETAGKVILSGKSTLKIGGNFIVVDGLSFLNGYAEKDAVITFRIDNKKIANNCRVTNTVINNYNNPKRMDENYWIAFYGKNNRLDHSSFVNKKNMGVLLAVLLDDERSRENFHSIDHNYFGVRLPLASNSGEIIRVGVSKHCDFNSNTQIVDNFFDRCDGETEIVSIKSGSNVVRGNLFNECQGGVVLRHGNFNTVENNVFLGNGKRGTGGVRIINKGQWVVNNLFYKCRGVDFRSPLSIMNGVPNSPAFRYVEVSEAVISNNSFIESTPISFCEGSDTERSVTPHHVIFDNNLFYNTQDSLVYKAFDDISGISFKGNIVNKNQPQEVGKGFEKTNLSLKKFNDLQLPAGFKIGKVNDSLSKLSKTRLVGKLSAQAGFNGVGIYQNVTNNAYQKTGASWWNANEKEVRNTLQIICNTETELINALNNNSNNDVTILLNSSRYNFTQPIVVNGNFKIGSTGKPVQFTSSTALPYLFEINSNSNLIFKDLNLDCSQLNTQVLVTTNLSGTSAHTNFAVYSSNIMNVNANFFNASKSVMLDSVVIRNSAFSNIKGNVFDFSNEDDKKGYYNVEKLIMADNIFSYGKGQLLTMLRGGNDESTMGPLLIFTGNTLRRNSVADKPLIYLYGTQQSNIYNNQFIESQSDAELIRYEDAVRAAHFFNDNTLNQSGKVIGNKFFTEENNKTTK